MGPEEFYGPLRIRDKGPFQLVRLNMLPNHANALTPGQFALELHWSASNTFAMDHDIAQYLAARGDSRDKFAGRGGYQRALG